MLDIGNWVEDPYSIWAVQVAVTLDVALKYYRVVKPLQGPVRVVSEAGVGLELGAILHLTFKAEAGLRLGVALAYAPATFEVLACRFGYILAKNNAVCPEELKLWMRFHLRVDPVEDLNLRCRGVLKVTGQGNHILKGGLPLTVKLPIVWGQPPFDMRTIGDKTLCMAYQIQPTLPACLPFFPLPPFTYQRG